MKRIKLEVLVENKDASETLLFFNKIKVNNIIEYTCSMEDVEERDG